MCFAITAYGDHCVVLLSRTVWPQPSNIVDSTDHPDHDCPLAVGAFGTALSYRKTGIAGFFLGDEAVKSGNKVTFFIQVCYG